MKNNNFFFLFLEFVRLVKTSKITFPGLFLLVRQRLFVVWRFLGLLTVTSSGFLIADGDRLQTFPHSHRRCEQTVQIFSVTTGGCD